MVDSITNYKNSVIQHGKENNRVYLMKLNVDKLYETLEYIDDLCQRENYTKVFAKVPITVLQDFLQQGYIKEAIIPNFYNGMLDGAFLAKYPPSLEKRSVQENEDFLEKVIKEAISKNKVDKVELIDPYEFYQLGESDVKEISSLYKKVFDSYPFPIFDPDYIFQTMKDNVCYFGIKKHLELVSIASSEMDKNNLNVEMTDFATLSEHRGNDFSLFLLKKMEDFVAARNFKTAYTIARGVSYGINIVFGKNGYDYAGTLVNNTNISGSIESMNVWYKSL